MTRPSASTPLPGRWLIAAVLALVLALPLATATDGNDPLEVQDSLPQGLLGPMVASDGEAIYVFGGAVGPQQVTADIIRVDPETLEANKVGELPAPRYAGSAAHLDGTIYIFGGANWVGGSPVVSDRIVAFDPATGTARNLQDRLPDSLFNTAAASDGERIYIFGGSRIDPIPERRDRIIEFDPNVSGGLLGPSATTTLSERLPQAVHSAAAAFDGERIVIAGGQLDDGVSDLVYHFDSSNKKIERAPYTLNDGVRNAAMIDGDGAVHLFGGSTRNNLADGLPQILRLTDEGIHRYETELPSEVWYAGAATIDNSAYLLAGRTLTDDYSRNATRIDLGALQSPQPVAVPDPSSKNETDADIGENEEPAPYADGNATFPETTGNEPTRQDEADEGEHGEGTQTAETDSRAPAPDATETVPGAGALVVAAIFLGVIGTRRFAR